MFGKFVSFEQRLQAYREHVAQGITITPEAQPVAFKATKKREETVASKGLPIELLQAWQRGDDPHYQELLVNPQAK